MDDRIKRVMASVFNLSPAKIGEKSSPDTVAGWDSVKHMSLVVALEEEFGIEFTAEEIAEIISFPLIRSVLKDKFKSKG